MIHDNFLVYDFKPLFLTVEGIGPFQEEVFQLDFTDENDEPCNIFLMMSQNGKGKTLLLDLMTALMSMLDKSAPDKFDFEDLDEGSGKVQWDFYVALRREGRRETIILSLVAGRDKPWNLNPWGETQIAKYGAEAWNYFGFERHASGRLEEIGTNQEGVQDLLAAMRNYKGHASGEFEDNPLTVPTLIHFSAYRDIPKITQGERGIMEPRTLGYKPVQKFGRESDEWQDSLDNLLVWLKWLDDGRFEQALKVINERIFKESGKFLKGVRKATLEAEVINCGYPHRLDRLSSGEKSLVQLYLRVGIHMTRNTILLIDEMDVHLHSKWQHNILNMLKQMAKEHPGLTIIVSSHARELIPAFAHKLPEKGLRKAGHLIEEGLV